jgi:hypothetical protein
MTPFIAGGQGPELAQAATGAAAMLSALFSGPIPQGKPAPNTTDLRSPQHFVAHPRMDLTVSSSAVGDETARESLPGRVTPSQWDGEETWLAALGGGW